MPFTSFKILAKEAIIGCNSRPEDQLSVSSIRAK
jgi:hypothetical protein